MSGWFQQESVISVQFSSFFVSGGFVHVASLLSFLLLTHASGASTPVLSSPKKAVITGTPPSTTPTPDQSLVFSL